MKNTRGFKRLFLEVFLLVSADRMQNNIFLILIVLQFIQFVAKRVNLFFVTLVWTLCVIKDSFVPLGQVEPMKKCFSFLTRLC